MAHKLITSRKLKVFRTHIGFDDLIIASPSRKAALEAWGASAHLFTQGFAAETDEPALVKAARARPGMVLRRQFGSRGEFKAERPALRLVQSPAKAPPKAPAPKAPARLQQPTPADRAAEKRAQRDKAAAERAQRRDQATAARATSRAAEAAARAEARQYEKEQKEAVAERRRDLQSRLQALEDERKQQLRDIDRREQALARERREIEQSFETRIVALRRRLRKASAPV